MTKIAEKIEGLLTEITFAEEGQIPLRKKFPCGFSERIDTLFTAITFAEAGAFDTARNFIGIESADSGRPLDPCMPRLCAGRV